MEVPTDSLNIENLPNEILSLIFQHLDFRSLLTCCLVCYRWFALVNEHRRINRRFGIRIDKDYLTEIVEAPGFVRSYSRVDLKSIQIPKWPHFADRYPRVEELKISRCEFDSWCVFVEVLTLCSRITTLDMYDTIILEDHDVDRYICSPGFNIRSGSLTSFDYHALQILNIFEAIGLRFGTVKVKLMGTAGFEDLENLFECIEKYFGGRLTEFSFLHNMSPQDNHRLFEYLSRMKQLRLQAFAADEVPRHSDGTDWFEIFLRQQSALKKFELTKSVTADQFDTMTNLLPGLLELRLTVKLESSFGQITENLGSFKRLKTLALTIEKFQDEHELVMDFLNDLSGLEQFSLEVWRLNSFKFQLKFPGSLRTMESMRRFSVKSLPEFWFHQVQIDDESIQEIIRVMPNLLELHLYKISEITPAAFLDSKHPLQQLTGLEALTLDTTAITEAVLLSFRFPRLRHLVLRGKKKTLEITDAALEQLARESPDLMTVKTAQAIIYKRNKATNQFELCNIPINNN